jgi:hypothetical protein
MNKTLVTFSGKIGDVLWSLPTVRQISKNTGVKVSMGIMPQYKSLLPLLKGQHCIENAFVIENWICTGSPAGDQPWEAPLDTLEHYDEVYHLTYRNHPMGNQPLVDFIAQQQHISLDEPVCPFIDCREFGEYPQTYIAYAFNDMYKDLKDRYISTLSSLLGKSSLTTSTPIVFQDVSQTPFGIVKYVIKNALCFVGCRSANWVIAHGVGQKNIIVFEPHPHRHHQGAFGNTFCNPHWPEITGPLVSNPEYEAERAANYIKGWVREKEEKLYATQTVTR